jgi:hypothetical protein
MKKLGFLIVVVLLSNLLVAQPATDIYIFDLSIKNKKVSLSNPVNITNRPGYDNQPFFSPDNQILYYVSADSSGRTDIFEFNYETKKTRQVTHTSEREYSPTITPDKKFISCIIQRDNGAQDLGKYLIDGNGAAQVLIADQIVGYHAWADNENVITFNLPPPFSLYRYDLKIQKNSVLTDSIGRSLHKIPGENSVSFVQMLRDNIWMIRKIEGKTFTISDITVSMPSKEHDMAWTSDGKILMSNESNIFFFNTKGKGEWLPVSIADTIPQGAITRLAINNKGDKLALVISE